MKFDNCPDVRIADIADEPELMRLTRLACAEDGQHSYNPDKVNAFLKLHFEKRGGIIGVIGDKGGELKAYLLMMVTEVWYSSDYHVQELSLFVAPAHRRSNYAKQLMVFAKKTSEALNLDLTIGVLSNERTEPKVRLYKRQFPIKGAFFVWHPAP